VPRFGRRSPPEPTDEEVWAREADLERIRRGGITLRAEDRVKRLAGASTHFFTSDLTAKEYALAEASGLQPVAQVMGSSVVRRGRIAARGALCATGEITRLAAPWNPARSRAFGRLRQEAELAGADGVIGIEMSAGSIGDGDAGRAGNAEVVVFGTAVRDRTLSPHSGGRLGMCTLSGQDVDKLRRIGAEACAVVGHTTVVSMQLGMSSSWVMNTSGVLSGAARVNTEITEIAECVYDARRRAMTEVDRQAMAADANGIVISTVRHTIDHYEYEQRYKYHYFHVTMTVLGTAIRLGAREPHPTPLSGPIMSTNLGA
jgi:uncharacterized protein YbjQ (UPF0145 family)